MRCGLSGDLGRQAGGPERAEGDRVRGSGSGRCVDGLLWRERLWLGVIHGAVAVAALVMGACGPSPVYTRSSLSETGAGGSAGGVWDGGSDAAAGGRKLAGSGGDAGGADAGILMGGGGTGA